MIYIFYFYLELYPLSRSSDIYIDSERMHFIQRMFHYFAATFRYRINTMLSRFSSYFKATIPSRVIAFLSSRRDNGGVPRKLRADDDSERKGDDTVSLIAYLHIPPRNDTTQLAVQSRSTAGHRVGASPCFVSRLTHTLPSVFDAAFDLADTWSLPDIWSRRAGSIIRRRWNRFLSRD